MIRFTPYWGCKWTPCDITFQPYRAHDRFGAVVFVQADSKGVWWAWQGVTTLAKASTSMEAAEQAFSLLRRRKVAS